MIVTAPVDDGGLGSVISDINFPGVVILATSGIVALIFIVRWMIRFQRDFTNFYVDENNKLRDRIDSGEAEAATKETELHRVKRETLEKELELLREISTLKATIARQDEIILALRRQIGGES